MFVNLMGGILGQCLHGPNHHVLHFKHLRSLLSTIPPIGLKKIEDLI